jgi:hypothetical protein
MGIVKIRDRLATCKMALDCMTITAARSSAKGGEAKRAGLGSTVALLAAWQARRDAADAQEPQTADAGGS